ncbi:MAG: S46 family peptidase [Planctomycetia bacterium]|jgi:hypothetical protein
MKRFCLLALFASTTAVARADEGMWLFNRPPAKQIKAAYGFDLTPEWLEHVQKSAVRISTGGSGSLVSADGLVMTNHHVGSDKIAELSTKERDLLKDGFHARALGEELKCPNIEMDVLWTIEDVSAKVESVVQPGMSNAQVAAARRAKLAEIESEAKQKAGAGFKCEIVTLWQGARYHLYTYKTWDDVRLVFAPEKAIGFFGGDADNFEYPRYCLDVCFFRIYEDGKPLKAERHLEWSPDGAGDGELVFVAGHPGRTERLNTYAHLEYMRDFQYPATMRTLWRREVLLATFMGRGEDNRREGEDEYFGVQNSRKARTGIYAGLLDPSFMAGKARAELELRAAVAANPEWAAKWGDGWDLVAQAKKVQREMVVRFTALGGPGMGLGGELWAKAATIVRWAEESGKPDGARLREYRSTAKATLERGLYSEAPIHADLEVERMASSLQNMAELLGGGDPTVVRALAGKSPQARAEELVRGTKLADVAERKRLFEGGAAAVAESKDPMIQLARLLDPENRLQRKRFEDEVDPLEKEGYSKVAAALFAKDGEDQYPDATFTLRLSYGAIKGYEQDGKPVPPFTNFAGLYERAAARGNAYPFEVPASWTKAKAQLNPATPFNFVSTNDIIGGNSGSPVINKDKQVVGLIFDGNIQSLVLGIGYDEKQGRAVSVDSRGLAEALLKVYGASELHAELMAGKR